MKSRHVRPSAPMLVSVIALVFALAGAGYALTLGKNTVGAKQITKNAVRSSEVKNGSLKAGDFAAGQLPGGAGGEAGSALAFARVGPDGGIKAGKNLAFTGRGTNPIKVYCFDYTGSGPVTNVQVTPDSSGVDPLFHQFAANVDRSTLDTFGCSAASDFLVSSDTLNGNQRGVDGGFFVAVIG